MSRTRSDWAVAGGCAVEEEILAVGDGCTRAAAAGSGRVVIPNPIVLELAERGAPFTTSALTWTPFEALLLLLLLLLFAGFVDVEGSTCHGLESVELLAGHQSSLSTWRIGCTTFPGRIG